MTEGHEFDADVLLYVKEQEGWLPKDYLETLWTALRSSDRYHDLAHRKTRCVRIDYTGEFHIDVVPYLERFGAHYITNRCEPEDTGRFELSNPEAFTAWVDERQRLTNRHFIKVVRLVKYLRYFKRTFSCKSIILMTLLGNRVTEVDALLAPERFADVPSTLVTLMRSLADWLPEEMPAVLDPGGSGDNFSERYRDSWNYPNFRTRIRDYATRMEDAYHETNREAAIAKWREVFGSDFKPESATEHEKAVRVEVPVFPARVPCEGERFIDKQPFVFPIRLDPRYRATIRGRVTGLSTNGSTRRNGFRQFDLGTRGNMVPKHRSLRFTVSTNVPAPYRVYWKVRNGGSEAAEKHNLRGEISQDAGLREKTETTLYKGAHYVECYIVKNDVVVAKAYQPVIVTS